MAFTSEQIYQRLIEDNGATPADEMAKSLGLKGHDQLLKHIGKHFYAVTLATGEQPRMPKLNIALPEAKKPKPTNLVTRTAVDARIQIGSVMLKELGFEEFASFEIQTMQVTHEGEEPVLGLYLKPIAKFGDETAPAVIKRHRRTKAELEAARAQASSVVPKIEEPATPKGIPATVTPAAQIPVPAGLDDDDELNANMI